MNMQALESWSKWFRISTFDDPKIERMVITAGAWAKAVREGNLPHWLVLLGKSGNGKTHICDKLWSWASKWTSIDNTNLRYTPHKVYWPDFVDKLRSGTAYELYEDMKRWPILYIDDAWANRASEFSEEKLNTLLGCRAGRWTMLTANTTMQTIAQRDARISSRFLRDGCKLIDIRTTDYNLRK